MARRRLNESTQRPARCPCAYPLDLTFDKIPVHHGFLWLTVLLRKELVPDRLRLARRAAGCPLRVANLDTSREVT